MSRILVVASTFPASDSDPVPAFVKDQIIAMKHADDALLFSVLAPHDRRSNTKPYTKHSSFDEYRFHYAWPHSLEKLAGRGILPALQANKLNYLLIPFLFVGEFFALYRLTRKLKPELIYAHWFTPQAVNARLVGALTKTPFVFTTHAADVAVWRKIPILGKLIVRSNVRKAQSFTAVSSRSMAKLQHFFDEKEWDNDISKRARIIPMGVSLPARRIELPQQKIQKVVFIGRLAEKKGVQYLLPAFAALQKDMPKAQLVIAGDGPMLDSFKAMAKDLGISDSVSFPGYTVGRDKDALLSSASVYVVPSIVTNSGDAEGLPVSLLEGLSYGNLCVATYESGADDIMTTGKDGILVRQKNSEALYSAIRDCLTMAADEQLSMRKQAQATAAQFSWSNIAKKHLSFFIRGK